MFIPSDSVIVKSLVTAPVDAPIIGAVVTFAIETLLEAIGIPLLQFVVVSQLNYHFRPKL